jgi:phenylacetate-CoA ligase
MPPHFDEWFSRRLGFPFIIHGWWRRTRGRNRFSRLLREHLAAEYWPAERVEALQVERLRSLLAHAGRRVPYYRELFLKLHFDPRGVQRLADIEALPPLTRYDVQEHEARLLADDARQRGLDPGRTGGSTGVALRFWYDRNFYTHAEAAAWTSDMAAGRRFGTRTAYLWGAPRDMHEFRGWRGLGRKWLRNERFLDSHVMWDARMRQYHRALEHRPPGVLVGFASSIYNMALYLEQNGLAPNYPQTALISSGEVLDAEMRAALERVFPAPVFDRYGSREAGLLAYECDRHTGLHLNPLDGYLECASPDGTGEPSEMLITQFHNYTMPLIRFEIGDRAVRDERPCPCGRTAPMLRRVAGRTSAAFVSSSGELIEGYHLIAKVRVVPGVREFQLIQEDVRRLRLLVVAGPECAPEKFAAARADIAAIIGADCELSIEFVDSIPLPPSGKPQMLISRVGRPWAAAGEAADA